MPGRRASQHQGLTNDKQGTKRSDDYGNSHCRRKAHALTDRARSTSERSSEGGLSGKVTFNLRL